MSFVLLLLNVDHFDLTAWIFWGIIVCVLVSCCSLGVSLKIVSQNRKWLEHQQNGEHDSSNSSNSGNKSGKKFLSEKKQLVAERKFLVEEMLKPENDNKRIEFMEKIHEIDKKLGK